MQKLHAPHDPELDQDRVRKYVIHYATPDGRTIPFCSMNTLHRSEIEKNSQPPLKIFEVHTTI